MNYLIEASKLFYKQIEELSDEAAELIDKKIILASINPYRFKRVKGFKSGSFFSIGTNSEVHTSSNGHFLVRQWRFLTKGSVRRSCSISRPERSLIEEIAALATWVFPFFLDVI